MQKIFLAKIPVPVCGYSNSTVLKGRACIDNPCLISRLLVQTTANYSVNAVETNSERRGILV